MKGFKVNPVHFSCASRLTHLPNAEKAIPAPRSNHPQAEYIILTILQSNPYLAVVSHLHVIFLILNALKKLQTLAGVAQWIEYWSANRKVASSISGQGTCLGCGPGPHLGVFKRQLIDVSLPPFPLSLKINK